MISSNKMYLRVIDSHRRHIYSVFGQSRAAAQKMIIIFEQVERSFFLYYLDSKEITEFQPLRDDIVLQQFLISLPSSFKSFIDARTPSSLSSASEITDLCFEITQSGNNSKFGTGRNNKIYTAKANANSDAVVAEVHNGANAKGEQVGVKEVCFFCAMG